MPGKVVPRNLNNSQTGSCTVLYVGQLGTEIGYLVKSSFSSLSEQNGPMFATNSVVGPAPAVPFAGTMAVLPPTGPFMSCVEAICG